MKLQDTVAVVAGATRGAGRGIARALGEAGATVYCTGRSVSGTETTKGRRETIHETAALVDAAGGKGIAVRVDHLIEGEVQALFEQVRSEQGRLDLIVNDIWGGDARTEWGTKFWEVSIGQGFDVMRSAIHTHVITSRYGAPLLIERGEGLIIEITDGSFLGYRGQIFYDLCKSTVIRLALAMAKDLRGTGVTALALTPGFLRSEAMLDHFGVTEENWREAIEKDPHFAESESPLYVGRAVVALATDPNVHLRAGGAFSSWALAREYGFKDADGRQPHWDDHIDAAICEILERDFPTEEELDLVRLRWDQLEFESSAIAANIEAFAKEHGLQLR